MGVYDRQIASAKAKMLAKGQSVTWRVMTDGVPVDANKPWEPAAASFVDNTVSIAFFPTNLIDKESSRYRSPEDIIQVGNEIGYMAAQTFVPSMKDIVIRGGVEIAIKSIDTLAPNGDVILYEIEFST